MSHVARHRRVTQERKKGVLHKKAVVKRVNAGVVRSAHRIVAAERHPPGASCTSMRVLLFAWAKELAGSASIEVCPTDPSVAALRVALLEALRSCPGAAALPSLPARYESCLFAVDDAFVDRDAEATFVIPPGSEVSLIPPVSGG